MRQTGRGRRVIVIGGGPAGLMAAATAAANGARVILLERNPEVGRKLLLTGGGRCNFTHDTDVAGLVAGVPGNGRFLYSALAAFDSAMLRRFFAGLGVESRAEDDGRVFPFSGIGRDVLAALTTYARRKGVETRCVWKAERILARNGKVCGVIAGRVPMSPGLVSCDAAIIATGGITYPMTGSTGNGYRMAAELGHTIVEPRAALVPLEIEDPWVAGLAGLALREVAVTSFVGERRVETASGEMLFTHFGVSGPVILALSREISLALGRGEGPARLVVDLQPTVTMAGLDRGLRQAFGTYFRRRVANSLLELVPARLISIVVHEAGIPEARLASQVTREERLALGRAIKGLVLGVKGTRPAEEGMVTAGGVCVGEIDPCTMESRLVSGVYFAGEVIDVDGTTGGFNLQAAFSTGYVAGLSAARGGAVENDAR
ncbi:MAG: NAD(P)/FAD-dependent oxidoreductase [Bacteroidota bacterium]